jgi:hypothetical protein
MNTFLGQDAQSRRRQLSIRTYRIVLLTPESGVLEFVENTKTLGSILVSSRTGGCARGEGGEEGFLLGPSRMCLAVMSCRRTSASSGMLCPSVRPLHRVCGVEAGAMS